MEEYLKDPNFKVKGFNKNRLSKIMEPMAEEILREIVLQIDSYVAKSHEYALSEEELEKVFQGLKRMVYDKIIKTNFLLLGYDVEESLRRGPVKSIVDEFTKEIVDYIENKRIELSEEEKEKLWNAATLKLKSSIVDSLYSRNCAHEVREEIDRAVRREIERTVGEIFSNISVGDIFKKEEIEELRRKFADSVRQSIIDADLSEVIEAELKRTLHREIDSERLEEDLDILDAFAEKFGKSTHSKPKESVFKKILSLFIGKKRDEKDDDIGF